MIVNGVTREASSWPNTTVCSAIRGRTANTRLEAPITKAGFFPESAAVTGVVASSATGLVESTTWPTETPVPEGTLATGLVKPIAAGTEPIEPTSLPDTPTDDEGSCLASSTPGPGVGLLPLETVPSESLGENDQSVLRRIL